MAVARVEKRLVSDVPREPDIADETSQPTDEAGELDSEHRLDGGGRVRCRHDTDSTTATAALVTGVGSLGTEDRPDADFTLTEHRDEPLR